MINRLMPNQNKTARDQSGFVSLLVVSVLAVVLALVAVGFSKLTNTELRQSLDRELTAQADFAADAGINDARAYLAAGGGTLTGCSDWQNSALGQQFFTDDLSFDASGNPRGTAKYSCVSINTTPKEAVYALRAGESRTLKLTIPGAKRLWFGWENQTQSNSGATLGSTVGPLPQENDPILASNNVAGVLRTAIYPATNNSGQGCSNGFGSSTIGTDTNKTLNCLSRTYYMYPNSGAGGAGSAFYNTTANASFIPGNCNTSHSGLPNNPETGQRFCNSNIDNLNDPSISSVQVFYVRITALYEPMNVTIQATSGNSLNPIGLDNAQAIVDITGKGTDQVQRVRARIDLNNISQTPTYAVQSMESICKGFDAEVLPGGQYGSTTIDGAIQSDSACTKPGDSGSIDTNPGLQPH